MTSLAGLKGGDMGRHGATLGGLAQQEGVENEGMPQPAALTGRALVRDRLVRHLAALPRPKRASAAAHAADLEALVIKLAHLTGPALDGVLEWALVYSGGRACPDVSLIRAQAYAVAPPPPISSDYAHSVLRSVMGRAAMEAGYAVELLRHARRFGPPPQKYIMHQLKDEADMNRRKREDIVARNNSGRAGADELRWLDAWWADHALCAALQSGDPVDDQQEGHAA